MQESLARPHVIHPEAFRDRVHRVLVLALANANGNSQGSSPTPTLKTGPLHVGPALYTSHHYDDPGPTTHDILIGAGRRETRTEAPPLSDGFGSRAYRVLGCRFLFRLQGSGFAEGPPTLFQLHGKMLDLVLLTCFRVACLKAIAGLTVNCHCKVATSSRKSLPEPGQSKDSSF